MSEALKIFKENLHRRIDELGLDQVEVARLAGMHRVQLGKYLSPTNETEPGTDTIERLATALGVAPWQLLAPPASVAVEIREVVDLFGTLEDPADRDLVLTLLRNRARRGNDRKNGRG